ncbi:MAG: hypothetical protein M3164_05750 [Actinomycetota bacterium]|nr:hypothetical protein [Actinomycetota bacterium]
MAGREARLALNEAISRQINERIKQSHKRASRDGLIRMVCECGHEGCEELIAISTEEYEEIRSDPLRFAVVKGHEFPDVEEVVAETDRYSVVRKTKEAGASVASEVNPRA